MVHAEKLQLALSAVRSGADGLVHAFWDTAAGPAEIREIQRSGAFVVPTLSVVDWGISAKELRAATERVGGWLSDTQQYLLQQQPEDRPGRPDFLKIGSANVGRLHAAGVPILAGTDTPIRANANGVSMLAEVAHLVRAGLNPRAALAAATSVLAASSDLPTAAASPRGLRADLVLVAGDPTTDITDLRAIKAGMEERAPRRPHTTEGVGPVDPLLRPAVPVVFHRAQPHRAASGSTTTTSLPRVCSSARFW